MTSVQILDKMMNQIKIIGSSFIHCFKFDFLSRVSHESKDGASGPKPHDIMCFISFMRFS